MMPREGAIIFRDIAGKLAVIQHRVKCGCRGRYHLHRLIERYGIDAKLFEWSDEITADCPRYRRMGRPTGMLCDTNPACSSIASGFR